MEFSIEKEKLFKGLRAVSGVMERKQPQAPVLANILLRLKHEDLTLIATDQGVELMSKVTVNVATIEGAITVPFRKLHDICKAFPDSTLLHVSVNLGKICLSAGNSKFTLSTLPAEQFPDVTMLDTNEGGAHLVFCQKQLRGLIEKTAFAMADRDVRYFLNGLLFEIKSGKLFTVAADGHRLAVNHVALSEENQSVPSLQVIVPRKGVMEMLRLLDNEKNSAFLTIDHKHIRLQVGVHVVTSVLLEGKYPDYTALIPVPGDRCLIGRRDCLREAFARASALFNERVRGIRLRLSSSRLEILGKNAESDEVKDEVAVEYQGPELEIGFNVRYLIDFLLVVGTEKVQLSFGGADSGTLMSAYGESNSQYVLMPIHF